MSWEAKVHVANVDASSTAYDEVLVTTVAALSGYQQYVLGVYSVDEQLDLEQGAVLFADGSLQQSRQIRYSYTLNLVPQHFSTGRDIITTELKYLLEAPHLWLELRTYTQNNSHNVGDTDTVYHTANYCIPVVIDSIDPQHIHDSGYKGLTINFKRKYRPQ